MICVKKRVTTNLLLNTTSISTSTNNSDQDLSDSDIDTDNSDANEWQSSEYHSRRNRKQAKQKQRASQLTQQQQTTVSPNANSYPENNKVSQPIQGKQTESPIRTILIHPSNFQVFYSKCKIFTTFNSIIETTLKVKIGDIRINPSKKLLALDSNDFTNDKIQQAKKLTNIDGWEIKVTLPREYTLYST